MKLVKYTLATLTIIAGLAYVGYDEHNYKLDATITAEENGVVWAETNAICPTVFTFYGEGFEVGEEVTLCMYDNCVSDMTQHSVTDVIRKEDK